MMSLSPSIPLVNTLISSSHFPKININIKPTLSSQTHVSKRSSAVAPPSVALRDDGASVAGESAEPFPAELVAELMPKHVAIILDGSGRWAKSRGLPVSAGHRAGMQSLTRIVRLCCSWGIQVLTVFMFSTENWLRPRAEVDFLFRLGETSLISTAECMKKEGIRLSVIGDRSKLSEPLQRIVFSAEKNTEDNSRLQLIVAAGYSGKYDLVQACQSVAKKAKEGLLHLDDINESIIEQELKTNCTEFPYPDLLIRTSGELRLSNFLLWQLAYTEFYFDSKLWPDFGKDEFIEALSSFQQRKRRYGRRHS